SIFDRYKITRQNAFAFYNPEPEDNLIFLDVLGEMAQVWFESDLRHSIPPSRLGQLGSIPALVLPSGGMEARHRKGATAERLDVLATDANRNLLWNYLKNELKQMKSWYFLIRELLTTTTTPKSSVNETAAAAITVRRIRVRRGDALVPVCGMLRTQILWRLIGGMNAQVGRLIVDEARLGGHLGLEVRRWTTANICSSYVLTTCCWCGVLTFESTKAAWSHGASRTRANFQNRTLQRRVRCAHLTWTLRSSLVVLRKKPTKYTHTKYTYSCLGMGTLTVSQPTYNHELRTYK
ncbi:hypothetical protein T265_14879, partial [Opisthorchis viverrini]